MRACVNDFFLRLFIIICPLSILASIVHYPFCPQPTPRGVSSRTIQIHRHLPILLLLLGEKAGMRTVVHAFFPSLSIIKYQLSILPSPTPIPFHNLPTGNPERVAITQPGWSPGPTRGNRPPGNPYPERVESKPHTVQSVSNGQAFRRSWWEASRTKIHRGRCSRRASPPAGVPGVPAWWATIRNSVGVPCL